MKFDNIPSEILLYESVYGNDFPESQYFLILFGKIPSKFTNKNYYDLSVLDFFKSVGFTVNCKIENTKKSYDQSSETILVNKLSHIIIRCNHVIDSKNNILTLGFTYDITRGTLDEQFNLEQIEKFVKPKNKSNISLVKSEMGHLDSEEYDLPIPELNLELNYGSNFLKIHDVIINRLNQDKGKGIILLHGEPGTGKTTYLKYLTKFIIEKEILFIPPSMAEMLSEPSIIPFLMEKKNSILLIEEADRVISDRSIAGLGSPAAVSNILNLTDGILGDCLNIQIIATFNTKREKIDEALLRKGRLICEHKFEKLSIEETNILLKELGHDFISNKEMTLADIYNIESDDMRVKKSENKIGFGK